MKYKQILASASLACKQSVQKQSAHKQSALKPAIQKQAGFTLIELMVVVVLVGILVTIAIPSYKRSVAKSDRSIAISDINKISQSLERFYSSNRTYSNDFGDLNLAANGVTELDSTNGRYSYAIALTAVNGVNNQGYNLTATPETTADIYHLRINQLGKQSQSSNGTDSFITEGWPK